jgi:hypothetical protein
MLGLRCSMIMQHEINSIVELKTSRQNVQVFADLKAQRRTVRYLFNSHGISRDLKKY